MIVALLAMAQTREPGHLAFSDEFDYVGRPDPAKWDYEAGFVRNKELQYYRPENARVEGGYLVIEGRREKVSNPGYIPGSADWKTNRASADYTSASVVTRGKFSWRYGRLEVRARFRPEQGLWPAIWTKGADRPWPQCGEVDVMEFYQQQLLANTAYGSAEHQVWDTVKTPISFFLGRDPDWGRHFHTWVMDWTAETIRLSVDGELLNQTDVSKAENPDGFNPFHQPHWLLLNLAIGATGGDPAHTEFPATLEVDYVRVYVP